MTFSIIVAWIAFVISTFLALTTIAYVMSRSELDQTIAALKGYQYTLFTGKFLSIIVIWFISGYYIFG